VGEAWGFIWVMFALKIPLAMLLWIVWWAVHATPEPVETDDDDGGIRPCPDGGPKAGPRKRGPHGDPVVPSPPRTRTPATARDRIPR
jgi:hypothetical protein